MPHPKYLLQALETAAKEARSLVKLLFSLEQLRDLPIIMICFKANWMASKFLVDKNRFYTSQRAALLLGY